MSGQPAPSLRVAECRACQQLFAVYEAAGVVACPGCGSAVELATLEVAEIGVASPVEVQVDAPAEAPQPAAEPETPSLVESAQELPAPTEAPEPQAAAEERPPTVAEWLLRGGDPNVTASETADPEPIPEPPTEPLNEPAAPLEKPKPSLSESLGWSPGSFALDGADHAARRELAEPDPILEPEPTAEPLAAADEFRFDFGATPLAEQTAEPIAEPVSLDLTSAPEPESVDEAAQPLSLEWTAPESPRRRSWSGPLSAIAGVLLVAAPAAWMAMTWPSDSDLTAAANRQQRDLLAQDDPSPPNPYPPSEEPSETAAATVASFESNALVEPEPSEPNSLPFGEDDAAPIRDPATQPASFDAPDPTFTPEPEAGAELPSDPFGPPTEPAPTAESSRYAVAAGDRYASAAPVDEPGDFSLPEDPPATPAPQAPAVRPTRPDPSRPGLVNVPYYGLDELVKAVTGGESAGGAFAGGTLSDPAQAAEMGKSYARLCYLAQVVTLLDPEASGPGVMTAELEATDVFNRLFREARPRDESRQIAGPWIAWTGRPHGGVFFAGKPTDMRPAGQTVEYFFPLGEETISVVAERGLDVDRFLNAGATEIGVIGILVDNPRERIAGYDGAAERVIWVRKTLALREPIEL